MISERHVEIPIDDIQPGDYVYYYSMGKPSGWVTRRVISKLRNGPQYQLTVEFGKKTEDVMTGKIKNAYREKATQERLVEQRAKEQSFHDGLMSQLKTVWQKKD